VKRAFPQFQRLNMTAARTLACRAFPTPNRADFFPAFVGNVFENAHRKSAREAPSFSCGEYVTCIASLSAEP